MKKQTKNLLIVLGFILLVLYINGAKKEHWYAVGGTPIEQELHAADGQTYSITVYTGETYHEKEQCISDIYGDPCGQINTCGSYGEYIQTVEGCEIWECFGSGWYDCGYSWSPNDICSYGRNCNPGDSYCSSRCTWHNDYSYGTWGGVDYMFKDACCWYYDIRYPNGTLMVRMDAHSVRDEGWNELYYLTVDRLMYDNEELGIGADVGYSTNNGCNGCCSMYFDVYDDKYKYTYCVDDDAITCPEENPVVQCILECEGTKVLDPINCVCNDPVETHRACVGEDCVVVDGAGTDECITDSQCILPVCGDNTKDSGEDCDGSDLGGVTCADFGMTGTLSCTGSCTYDTSGCTSNGGGAVCGNGVIETGEDCDGSSLGGKQCSDISGYSSGTLDCSGSCTYDNSGCVADEPTPDPDDEEEQDYSTYLMIGGIFFAFIIMMSLMKRKR